jgi:hypothetical protein
MLRKKVVFKTALISKKAKDSATLHRDPRLFLLIPLFFYSGYEQSLRFTNHHRHRHQSFHVQVEKKQLDLSSWVRVHLVLPGDDPLLGRLSNTLSRQIFLIISMECHLPFYLFFGLTALLNQ